jgi:hypothetical protein
LPLFAYATVKPPPVSRVFVALRDESGNAMARRPYLLRLAGGAEIDGASDAQGIVDQAVAGSTGAADLVLLPAADWPFQTTLRIQLEPLPAATEVKGAQARLNALGYAAGLSGVLDEPTSAALQDFQLSEGLAPTGALDADTARALDARWLDL